MLKKLTNSIVFLMLAGCAHLPPQNLSCYQIPEPTRQQHRQQLTHWLIKGHLNIVRPQQKLSATLIWQQKDQQHYRITLLGPLGFGAIRIDGAPNSVTLHDRNHIIQANSPESLMQQQLGWHLPISQLFYWLRGLPSPHSHHHHTTDNLRQIITITDHQWQVQLKNHHCHNGLNLPEKLVFHRQQPELTATITVNDWVTGQA